MCKFSKKVKIETFYHVEVIWLIEDRRWEKELVEYKETKYCSIKSETRIRQNDPVAVT